MNVVDYYLTIHSTEYRNVISESPCDRRVILFSCEASGPKTCLPDNMALVRRVCVGGGQGMGHGAWKGRERMDGMHFKGVCVKAGSGSLNQFSVLVMCT